jgi:hypothetical protein
MVKKKRRLSGSSVAQPARLRNADGSCQVMDMEDPAQERRWQLAEEAARLSTHTWRLAMGEATTAGHDHLTRIIRAAYSYALDVNIAVMEMRNTPAQPAGKQAPEEPHQPGEVN